MPDPELTTVCAKLAEPDLDCLERIRKAIDPDATRTDALLWAVRDLDERIAHPLASREGPITWPTAPTGFRRPIKKRPATAKKRKAPR